MELRTKQALCILGITVGLSMLFFIGNPSVSESIRTVSTFSQSAVFLGLFGGFWLAFTYIGRDNANGLRDAKPVIFGVGLGYGLVVAIGTAAMMYQPTQYLNWQLAGFGALGGAAVAILIGYITLNVWSRWQRTGTQSAA
ncbi:MAG: hypothetical protein AAGJ10_18220 [Bacteroidota bacterium]